jgi:hypothetical protein
MAACNGDALDNVKTKHVADVICNSYLSSVLDSLEAQHYRVKVPNVCMPDSKALFEQASEVMEDFYDEAGEQGGSLPYLHDVLVLYRGYAMEEPIYGSSNWRIALHRTPFETVTAALHEAWPCDNYDANSDGYHVIVRIMPETF